VTAAHSVVRPRPAFSHASEAELARIFDFYDVRWEYEPDTFPIGWTLDGDVVESFAPDFYLPEMDLYVELTTLKQSLVRKKNRKLRRLRELYPDVRIKLFYARDFRMLLLKFGRLALADELSGTTGQATPPRLPATPVVGRTADGVPAPNSAGASADLPEPQAGSDDTRDTDEAGFDAAFEADEAEAVADLAPASGSASPSRGRRRGRRRRAAARAAALAAQNAPASVTALTPPTVPPAGTYPA
jgi:hypoxanthine phosphoribosyltransferase